LDIRAVYLLSIGMGFLLLVLVPTSFLENAPDVVTGLHFLIIFLVIGFPGLVGLKQKNSPSQGLTKVIRGKQSLITNWLWVIFWYGMAIIVFIMIIKKELGY